MKRNQKQTNAVAILRNFESTFTKATTGNYSQRKAINLLEKLLKSGLKDYSMKPLLVFYLTPQIQHEMQRDNTLMKQIRKNTKDKYLILVLPAMNDRLVRAEVWHKGKIQYHQTHAILEKAFENREHVSFSQQAVRGIQEALREMGMDESRGILNV